MRIAVTGATGMLGEACIRRFVERGDEVVAGEGCDGSRRQQVHQARRTR